MVIIKDLNESGKMVEHFITKELTKLWNTTWKILGMLMGRSIIGFFETGIIESYESTYNFDSNNDTNNEFIVPLFS